jgi:DNA-binding MarR family transcriptional regulator
MSRAEVDSSKLFRVFARWVEGALVTRTLASAEEAALRPAQGPRGRNREGRAEQSQGAAITHAQLRCLDFLARHKQCSVGELSQGLAISDPAATKLVDRLQSKGVVSRRASRDDRRVVYVELSELGCRLIARLGRKRDGLMQSAVESLSARNLEMLVRFMESVLMSALDSPQIIAQVCLRCGDDHSPDCVVNRAHIVITGNGIPWL